MVDLSPAKILVVLVVALVVLGPDKLPRMARQAGRLVSDFRRFRDSLSAEVREAFGAPGAVSNLQNLSALSNLPARGRAWVTSVATGSTSSTPPSSGTPPSGTPPATTPPEGESLLGPRWGGSPGQGHGAARDGAIANGDSPGSDGGSSDPRFN